MIARIENWLREPPEWFLNLMVGVAAGLMVLGILLALSGYSQLARL